MEDGNQWQQTENLLFSVSDRVGENAGMAYIRNSTIPNYFMKIINKLEI